MNDIEFLADANQKDFLHAIDSINEGYKKKITRGNNAEKFARWGLTAIADGIGGCIGVGVVSWFTGAAASTAYNLYLDHCQAIVSRACCSLPNITRGCDDSIKITDYEKINSVIAFQFCDNDPQVAQDSIGYAHNKLLDNIDLYNDCYLLGSHINYDYILDDCKNTAMNLELPYSEIETVDRQKYGEFCDNMILALSNLYDGAITYDAAFNNIEYLLKTTDDITASEAKFISTLAKHIAMCLSEDIEINNIESYSEELSDAIKNSDLSESEISLCKKLLQTAVCSYAFWNYHE